MQVLEKSLNSFLNFESSGVESPVGYSWEFLEGALFLRRGLFVLWGGWGEKKESTWETVVPRALSIFSIIAIFVGIPSGSLCGGDR